MTLTLVAILYISLQFVAQGVLGPDLAIAKAPLVATATAVFGSWARGFWWALRFYLRRAISRRTCCAIRALCMPLLRPDSCRGSWPPFIRDLAHQPSPSELMRVSVSSLRCQDRSVSS